MYNLFIIITLAALVYSNAANAFTNSLEYQIKYSNNQQNCLDIILNSYTDQNGKYTIQFPMGAGTFTILSNGKSLKIIDTNNPYIKELQGDPENKIEIKYTFCLNNTKNSIEWPIIEKDYFMFKLDKVLAVPEHKNNLKWKSKIDIIDLPKEFTVFSSFTQNSKNFTCDMPISKFKNSMIVGGHIRPQKLQVNKKSIFLIPLGDIQSLSHKTDYILKNLIKEQRSFWQDNDFENYLVVLHERPCNASVGGASGIHPENAIILQLSNCGNKLDYRNIYGISHELFHAWIGHKMAFGLPHGELQWFLEGINDFFGLHFALKSKAISEKEYIEMYNLLIRSYYLLPINNLSNFQIIKNYFNDPFYHQLAQIRGHLFAKTLALNLKDESSFMNIIHDIYDDYKNKNNQFVVRSDIDKIFHKHLKKKLWKDYVQQIYNGNLIQLSDRDLGGRVKLFNEIVEIPDIGFNILNLITNHTISEIDPDSPAFKAGLRNGQKVKHHSISLINADRNMSVWIEEDGKFHEISFLPNRKKDTVPQYKFIDRKKS